MVGAHIAERERAREVTIDIARSNKLLEGRSTVIPPEHETGDPPLARLIESAETGLPTYQLVGNETSSTTALDPTSTVTGMTEQLGDMVT